MSKTFFILMLIFLLNSCLPLTSYSLKNVNVSDTKEKVVDTLGKPYTKRIYYNKEFMVYYIHDSFFSLFFNTKEFPFIGFYPFLRTGTEYWIILEDNKVVASGPAKNFGNSISRGLSNSGVSTLEVIGN